MFLQVRPLGPAHEETHLRGESGEREGEKKRRRDRREVRQDMSNHTPAPPQPVQRPPLPRPDTRGAKHCGGSHPGTTGNNGWSVRRRGEGLVVVFFRFTLPYSTTFYSLHNTLSLGKPYLGLWTQTLPNRNSGPKGLICTCFFTVHSIGVEKRS